MTKDDFVTQILAAEKEAADSVQAAAKKAQNDLNQYEAKLAQGRETALEKLRSKSKEKLKDRQAAARKKYEDSIAEGKREAASLEKDVTAKLDKHMSTAQAYFLNELLG